MVMLSSLLALALAAPAPQPSSVYRQPPQALADLVDAAPPPSASVSPDRRLVAILERPPLPPVAELAQPELRLAGLRFDPRSSAPTRREAARRILVRALPRGELRPVTGLPDSARIAATQWAPDGSRIALTVLEDPSGEPSLRLWLLDPLAAAATRALDVRLNAVSGHACTWASDARSLLCLTVPAERASAPVAPAVPPGPVVQESAGRKAGARTFQDLLKSPHDEDLLEHHLRAEIVRVPAGGGAPERIGGAATYLGVQPSPDGSVLLVETLQRPYSYRVPLSRFPRRAELWDPSGKHMRTIADLPLRDEVPVAFDAVSEGPRAIHFRDDAPAAPCWVEARDGGDPKRAAEVRDELLCLDSARAAKPRSIARLAMRFSGVRWSSDALAIVDERWWETRRARSWLLAPGRETAPRLLFDRSSEDRYSDPGRAVMEPTRRGGYVLRTVDGGKAILLEGEGASPNGDHPFVDKLDLATKRIERLWQCAEGVYERPFSFLAGDTFITSRQSKAEPPNFFLRSLRGAQPVQLTHYQHPAPALAKVEKRLLKYKRKDGLELTATLYLPPGHDPARDGRLPLLMWIYPHEFKSAAAASQVRKSQHLFIRPNATSSIFALLMGFAVLDDPAMPIVGEGAREPNDSYVEQLAMGAQAAVDEVVRLGVADRERIAVGGHSYGAFTTANLLAHTSLFRAGIARSGAYNRTLTPFGFQQEQRTYWDAPDVYAQMSPFHHARKIKSPLLLIHGEADNNAGTFPLQSERLYDAIKGLGGTARLILLPHESHGYRGRESVLHVLHEEAQWLEKHVKPLRAASAAGQK